MPSGAVKEGRAKAQEVLNLINYLLTVGGGYLNPAAQLYLRILGGIDALGADILGPGQLFMQEELERFRGTGQITYPPEIWDILNRLTWGAERAEDILRYGGVTERTGDLRDRLNDILYGRTFEMAALRDYANEILTQRGITPQMQVIQDALTGLLADQGYTDALRKLEGTGLDILAAGGRTPESIEVSNLLRGIISAQGRDAALSELSGVGRGLIDSGGMTPEMRDILSPITKGMETGGMTPEARQLFGAIMPIIQSGGRGGALLPMEQVVSMARDAAATAYNQRAEAARREAMQRMGGAIGAGTVEQALAEFADEAARGEAEAIRGAVSSQQALQLQQLLGAMGAGADITKAAQALLSSYATSASDIARSAAMNIGTGADLMKTAEAIAAQRLGTAVSGFENILGLENQRLGLGAGMVTDAQRAALERLGLGTQGLTQLEELARLNREQGFGALSQYIQNQLGAGDTLAQVLGIEAGREIEALRNLIALSGTAADTIQSQIDQWLMSMGLQADIANQFVNWFLQAAGGLTGVGEQYMGVIPSGMSAFGNLGVALIGAALRDPGFWNKMWQAIVSGGIGGIFDAIGGVIGGKTGDIFGGIGGSIGDIGSSVGGDK